MPVHPQVFLKTFWRLELLPRVFVAMDFGAEYQRRYDQVIAPAICQTEANGRTLQPYRVDLSKSGDSILTDIIEGIAHSQMVLADVSTIGADSKTGKRYRNGNVMYEVGLALACRHPSEVLLIRDDEDRFLFDVSTIFHKKIDFTDTHKAIIDIRDELRARLKEQRYINDARVQLAITALSGGEINLLKDMASRPATTAWGRKSEGDVSGLVSIPRLLDKQLIRVVGEFPEGYPAYLPTPLGYVVAKAVESGLPQLKPDPKPPEAERGGLPAT